MQETNYTIAGVSKRAAIYLGRDADALSTAAKLLQAPEHFYNVTMRLKPGVTHAAADAASATTHGAVRQGEAADSFRIIFRCMFRD